MLNSIDKESSEFIGKGMSNFDNTIDEGFAENLKATPNKVFGQHSAWNFCGWVWFDGSQFCEEVCYHKHPIKIVKANSLSELMQLVNDEFGWE